MINNIVYGYYNKDKDIINKLNNIKLFLSNNKFNEIVKISCNNNELEEFYIDKNIVDKLNEENILKYILLDSNTYKNLELKDNIKNDNLHNILDNKFGFIILQNDLANYIFENCNVIEYYI